MVDIIILAVIVAVLIFQLRRVLGERDEGEQPPAQDPFAAQPVRQNNPAQTPLERAMNAKPVDAKILEEGLPHSSEPLSVNQGLQQVKDFDSEFDERAFMQGARAAFEMIVKAYARGDLETLKNLLSPKLYDHFAEDAKARAQKDYTMETNIHRLAQAHIVGARMIGFEAEITVEFISEQTSVVRNSAGEAVAGNPDAREEIRDTWVFRRDTRGTDPSWQLTETHE